MICGSSGDYLVFPLTFPVAVSRGSIGRWSKYNNRLSVGLRLGCQYKPLISAVHVARLYKDTVYSRLVGIDRRYGVQRASKPGQTKELDALGKPNRSKCLNRCISVRNSQNNSRRADLTVRSFEEVKKPDQIGAAGGLSQGPAQRSVITCLKLLEDSGGKVFYVSDQLLGGRHSSRDGGLVIVVDKQPYDDALRIDLTDCLKVAVWVLKFRDLQSVLHGVRSPDQQQKRDHQYCAQKPAGGYPKGSSRRETGGL